METIKNVFLLEARDQLETLETALLALERHPGDEATLHEAFRAAHTLKGSSSMADALAITAFTHHLENVLDRMREGELAAEASLMSALLACADHVHNLLQFFQQDTPLDAPTQAAGAALLGRLKPWLEAPAPAPAHIPTTPPLEALADAADKAGALRIGNDAWHIRLQLGPEIFQRGVEPIGLIRYLGGMAEWMRVRTLSAALPDADAMDPELCYLGFVMDLRGAVSEQDIEDAFVFLQGECVLTILPPHVGIAELAHRLQALRAGSGPADDDALLRQLIEDGVLDAAEAQQLRTHFLRPEGVGSTPEAAAAIYPPDSLQARSAHPGLAARASKPIERAAPAQLRVDADKLDQLVDLVGELVIAGAAASVMAARVGQEDLNEALSVVSRLIEDMRESAMQMRMVQIGATFNRFRRVVRDVSQELGKDIELFTEGGDTELDKSVVEKIGDPLMHLVRNSIDHGIESAAQRLRAGKSAKGRITLTAQHEAGSIIIQIHDDGGGLHTQKILSKAIERKLVSPSQTLTEAEIHQLIFEPGFSTAEQVTELSGRGVGMDVVRRNIQALRGSVAVNSRAGEGCTFTIRLPLTLAIIDGFRVGIGDAHFVIPLEMVAECIQHDGKNRSCDYLSLRGNMLPFVRLRELFGSQDSAGGASENVVIVRHGDQQVGIVVEKLYGEMQAVIKPLGVMFQGIKGLAGSTLLGGGEIAVILDIPALIEGAIHARL